MNIQQNMLIENNIADINAKQKNIVTLAPEGNTTGENPTINLEMNPPMNMNTGKRFCGKALTSIMQLLIKR